MTTTQYFIARLGATFGISRRQRRMAEAATETHLLREAEQILGELVWDRVEEVEELGIEYWNLRRLITDRDRLRKTLDDAEAQLSQAHDQRAEILSTSTSPEAALEEERTSRLAELEALAKERDAIVIKARELRRLYDGLKTKLEVLRSEKRDDVLTIDKTRERMKALHVDFDTLKSGRDSIAHKIEAKDAELEVIEGKINASRRENRDEASKTFQVIGDANRKISAFKAELGVIETRMQQLFGEVGRHVSRNIAASAACRAATTGHRPMVEVMRALRKSINLNHRLAGI